VRPDSFYRFERALRTADRPFCDLVVVESRREPDDARVDAERLFLAGRGEALKVHRVALQAAGDGGWQRGGTSFYPTPRTRSLVVLVRTDVGAGAEVAPQPVAFDDVRLEEVLPTRSERVRLLKGAHHARGADRALGVHKAGLLLPLPSPDGARAGEAAESNYDWREALYAPPPTALAFDLVLPDAARLRLATGLFQESPPGSKARFEVELHTADASAPARLLERTMTASMEAWRWEEADVDLSAWAGRAVTLVLSTHAEEGDPHPLWANPRVEPAGHASDPLVILIAVDTLRADRLSAYGHTRPTSPALDRLAAEGVRFDQARSNCNWTCPSFASIFTGLVPSRHGVSSYGPATPLPEELDTLAELFQQRGFATRSIAYKVPLFDGNYEQGFDQAYNVPRDVIRGEENLARALEWLEGHRGGPAFLFLHFNDPHQPFVQPEPYDRKFGPAPEEMPPRDPSGADGQRMFSDLYDGAVAYVDACIGRFLDQVRTRGLYDGATIAFVADHGEALWEHGRFGHGGNELYDEVVRVPLLVKPPQGTFEPGKVVTADVSGFDVMPTLLELTGLPVPEGLDARSLVPLVRGAHGSGRGSGEGSGAERARVVVTETSLGGLGVVSGGYKYVLHPRGGGELLFHLPSDPGELANLAEERPAELERMRALAIDYLLAHRPGTYVLVRAGAAPVRVTVAGSTAHALVGTAAGAEAASDTEASTLELAAGALVLLELDSDAARVAVEGVAPGGDATAFELWTSARPSGALEPGLWRVRGPEPGIRPDTSTEPIDEELLKALRELGYAE
jgi:arylsulfatase A-like enzyme